MALTSSRPWAAALGLSLVLALLTACGSMPKLRWPFGAKPVPPPVAVDELAFDAAPDGAAAVAYPQYWKRNTLVLDLQSAAGAGSTSFRPKTPAGWPVRIALRVRAGSMEALEVRGEQRSLLSISPAAQGLVDLELDPTVYRRSTPSITVAWGTLASLAAPTAPPPDPVQLALASPERLPGDLAEDARRKSDEVLQFLGVKSGMRVLDAFAAGGYYTELLSRIVGPGGEVIAYNNPPYAKFGEKRIAERYAGNRLPNVRPLTATIEELALAPASLDAVIFIMSYHDLYWRTADGSWPPTDPAALLRKLYAALKPGGVMLVEDHAANAGGDPTAVVNALHRIDPAIVVRDFTAVGLLADGESKILAHPEDDHTKPVFDPAVQGKTDQFILRFRKPAS